ncbi:MAG: hybrid sensor histidine kinase/response regulator [Bdellovibrionaceae bacterium]|nr:hybrid sensor histidine kinase/response regulator [Pseudobdellovibrionaceae bacterium]
MEYEILLVDDEPDNIDALERLFRKSYKVHKAISGKEALKILKEQPHIALILTDQRMPEMTGVQLLKKSINSHPFAIRILLTGYTDVDSIVDSINSGEVYRYLNKPWDPVDLKNTIDKAIEKYKLRQELVDKNERLEQALTELQSLDKAKTNFMILINHELKTPLTVITSFLDLLKESSLDDEQKMYVDRIEKSRKRLQQLIDSSLELIAAETGQTKVNKKSISSVKFIEDIKKEYLNLPMSDQRPLAIDAEDIKLKIDDQIIKQITKKLLENAIKFSPEKSEIKIQLLTNNNDILFKISNKGPKMDKNTIQKILKPFSLDEDIMNHTQGLGLGLSTCQALIKAHGSELEIHYSDGWVTVQFFLT